MNSETVERERLEREADLARSRLANTIDALDQKRHAALDLRAQLRPHLPQLIAAGAVAALALVGGVVFSVVRARQRSRQKGRARVAALARAWQHPERVAGDAERSLPVELGRKLVMSVVSVAATVLARRVGASFALPAPRKP